MLISMVEANTFYEFEVACDDGTFSFDFGGGAATVDFTDPTVTATSGQVGMVLDTLFGSATRLDNFSIAPVLELIPGDANGDRSVDVIDLGILATHYHTGGGHEWGDGDFTYDGYVDVIDLGILATHYGETFPVASVPEPSMLASLLGLCLAGLARLFASSRRKR